MRRTAALLALAAACGDDLGHHQVPAADAAPASCRVPVSHPTIQAAVDDAACPVVAIEAGIYLENIFIARSLALEGVDGEVVIDGGGRDSVLIVDRPEEVRLTGLVIQHGRAVEGGGIAAGGPIVLVRTVVRDSEASRAGGGISARSSVRLEQESVVERNRVSGVEGTGWGGGISADSVELVERSSVRENRIEMGRLRPTFSAIAEGGGIRATSILVAGGSRVYDNRASASALYVDPLNEGAGAMGGGIQCAGSPGSVQIVDDGQVFLNEASAFGLSIVARGGGIDSQGCDVLVERSAVGGNRAIDDSGGFLGALGGGIHAEGGTVRVVDAEVAGNHAISDRAAGGGISIGGVAVSGALIVNSTVDGNVAAGTDARGGGVASGSGIKIFSSTLVYNRATHEGGGIASQGPLAVANTIVWGNTASDAPDVACAEPASSRGYNLWGDPTGCELAGDAELDQVGADPQLGWLIYNGGPTASRLPRPGSPAIDGGDPAGCVGPGESRLASDQRGLPRPVGRCDVGAVEVQPAR